MRCPMSLAAAAGLVGLLLATDVARGQPYVLRRNLDAGQASYERQAGGNKKYSVEYFCGILA